MRFAVLAGIETAATLAAVVVALWLAVRGAGYWALLGRMLVAPALVTALAWWACRWRPGRPAPPPNLRRVLAFGGNITGFNLANYFGRNLDDVLIAKTGGEEVLGQYQKAYDLLMLPLRHINARSARWPSQR